MHLSFIPSDNWSQKTSISPSEILSKDPYPLANGLTFPHVSKGEESTWCLLPKY